MSLGPILWIITIVMCGAFLYISMKFQGEAKSSFSNYAIGGKSFPMYLIFFTQFATIMGVGNFVGHAGKGYQIGLPWMAFILGEQGSKIIFALFFAGLAGRFTYNTFPEMIDDLIARDKITRALSGLLASMIMIAWVGGQGKAFGNIFNIATGANPIPVILLFSAVFIVYTALGGIYSVVWTDLLQGIMVLIFGTIFYIYAFAPVHWSFTELLTLRSR
ncbi:sodium:proline symporter [Candidatus Vecturithrix granuli]|uniref:Sodium:proline symporter n=1 Tax=Vecturithrix granuli TaxID=1499967 RepID=A0A081C805_VECG1|nr:sodium:proline symporter [Candidatus Vecturithrix granuli]